MHAYHLLRALLKLLLWVEDKLPDDPGLGLKLLLAGAILFLPLPVPGHFAKWGFGGDVLLLNATIAGGVCSTLGSYILFRHGIWKWQDRRASRTISLRLK